MITPFPSVVRIEPAGLCNFKCIHCPVGVEGGRGRIMTYDEYVRIYEILPTRPRVLVLYHGGEPLLNRDLEKIAAHAKLWGVEKVVMNTNTALISETRDLSNIDELRCSFDGESPEDNNRIRKNGNFARNAAHVKELALSDKRPKVIKIYNARKGTDQVAQYLLDYFADCPGMEFEGVELRTWARVNNEPAELNGAKYCENLFETFTVTSNGDVVQCCEDLMHDNGIGSVYQNSPAELWERMEQVREDFSKGIYPKLCQSCWVLTKGVKVEKRKVRTV